MSDVGVSELARAERAALARPAVVFEGSKRSHRALQDRAGRVAAALIGVGIEPGDRVAVLSPNCLEYLEIEAGIRLVGAVLATVDWKLPPAAVADQLRRSEARLAFAGGRLLSMLGTLRRVGEAPQLRTIVALGRGPGDLDYEELCAASAGPSGALPDVLGTGDAIDLVREHDLRADSSTYVVADLSRAGSHELAWPMLRAGGTTHVRPSGVFAARPVLRYIGSHGITHVVWTPAMLWAVLENGDDAHRDTSRLRMVLCAPGPGAAEVIDAARAAMPHVTVATV